MQALRVIALLVAGLLAAVLVRSQSAGRVKDTVQLPLQLPSVEPYGEALDIFGLAIQVDSSYMPVERYGTLIREVAALGANSVLLSVNGYQENAGSAIIYTDPEKTPTDTQWLELFAIARQEKLKIIFMPKVLLAKPRGKEWRGVINPGHAWDEWFDSYSTFLLHYAELAEQGEVEMFCVGSELVSTEKYTEKWEKIIAQVRQRFQGWLTYSANWDHYQSIAFWDELDLVAMTSYYSTAREANPAREELLASWLKVQEKLLSWREKIGKPLLFTEVGWCSQEGCSSQPWNYYLRSASSAAGQAEQELNYAAFIESWHGVKGLAGVIWWEWLPTDGGMDDYGYSPKNKPAEQLLREWFATLRPLPTTSTAVEPVTQSAPAG
ncbi:MAG: hypothetical protein HJJLKODD_00216 [Phycisphaerae bacterium]|nr:hypothetical protein [Phycisphaerae bacterium]